MKFKDDLKIQRFFMYDPSKPVPDDLPASATSGLRGPQCVFRDERSGSIYHMAPHDCMLLVDDTWVLLNVVTANVLLEAEDVN